MRILRILVGGWLLANTLAPLGAVGAAAPPASSARWIAVSVATLWVGPGRARAVDGPASATPARPQEWLSAMSLGQRKWLNGNLETQALYGTAVQLVTTSGQWSQVAVPGQPTPRSAAGYPGWLPTSQLTDRAPQAAPLTAVVTRKFTDLYSDAARTVPSVRVSYGTVLPAVTAAPSILEVVGVAGERLFADPQAVSVRNVGAAAPPATGAAAVAEARKFLGVGYLWGGTSGFGFDCSGLTHAVYARLGITIPRDAGPQFATGRKVSRAALRKGDLVFFRNSSGIHHVGMYIGGGRMIHSPRTGRPVQVVSLKSAPYSREFAGGRRYVG